MGVRRLAPNSDDSKQHPVMCIAELYVVTLKRGPCRASVQESLYYLELHHPGLHVQQACLRAVVKLLLVAPSADMFGVSK